MESSNEPSNSTSEIVVGQWYREAARKVAYKVISLEEATMVVYHSREGMRTINRTLFEVDLEAGQLLQCEKPDFVEDETPSTPILNELSEV